jgi:hypothetical protein
MTEQELLDIEERYKEVMPVIEKQLLVARLIKEIPAITKRIRELEKRQELINKTIDFLKRYRDENGNYFVNASKLLEEIESLQK